uniref:dTDP-4-dehydrorhamnose 3,5-epimerase n=1 Tax=Rhizobium leguminosarum bv. trifolii TaxID=386 RepID=Q0PW71_RHILT|nr:RfbC [Rhizobium leguminosarum bv. trifolii TA1]
MDVVVDIREGSPSFGKWLSQELSPENGMQLWVPAGFAHGFATLEPNSVISYKVTAPYSPQHDRGIAWNDPAIGIRWPFDERDMVSSDKDKTLPRLTDLQAIFPIQHSNPRIDRRCASWSRAERASSDRHWCVISSARSAPRS